MKPANTFPSVGLLRKPSIEAVVPITTMAQTNSSPRRRWTMPPFFTEGATAARTQAGPPAHTWLRRSQPAAAPGRPRPAPPQAPQSARREDDGVRGGHAEGDERPDPEEDPPGPYDPAADKARSHHVQDGDARSKERPEE